MTEKLEANKDQIEHLIKDIMEATKHAQRVSFLKMLQDQIMQFLQASKVDLVFQKVMCFRDVLFHIVAVIRDFG